jgi:hypothetical protein
MRFPASLFVPVVALTLAIAPTARCAAEKSKASLPEALEHWIKLVEQDDLKAAKQWAANPEAEKKLEQTWPQVRQCHKEYDYRRWIERQPEGGGAGAKGVGDATSFTVGGHSFGHVHVKWEKSDAGWRIADVFMCR